MDTASMPIPGALRLRPLQPLVDPDGSCRRVFDLERAAEVEVPQELRLYVAAALESGDFDEALLSWLVSEGLITSEGRHVQPAGEDGAADRSPRGRRRLDGELHARLDLRADEGLATALDLAFAEAEGAKRLVLHLGCGGAFPSASTLERVVVETEQRAYEAGLQVLYELALAPAAITTGIVRFVAETPLHLRIACEVPAAAHGAGRCLAAAENAAGLVLEGIPDRLTFQAVLGPGSRLRDVTRWARERHLLHLDVLVLGPHPGGVDPAAVDAYRRDLLAAAEEFAADLAQDRPPLDLQPLTGITRRLLRAAAAGDDTYRPRGLDGGSFLAGRGLPIVVPAAALEPMVGLPHLRPASAGTSRCAECWARKGCGASTELAAAPASEPGWGPSRGRCDVWRAEVDAALHLARRLAGPQAPFALRLLEEMGRAPLDPFAPGAWSGEALSAF